MSKGWIFLAFFWPEFYLTPLLAQLPGKRRYLSWEIATQKGR